MEKIQGWEQEHPLQMKKRGNVMLPQDIIEGINHVFDEGIIVTDVGQHQMFAAQYAEITPKKRLLMSGGLARWDMDSREESEQRSAIRINR